MEVGFAVLHLECNLHHWIESLHLLPEMVTRSIEGKAIRARANNFVFRQQLSAAAVFIGLGSGENAPFSGGFLPFEAHGNILCGLPLRGIQNVSGNSTHDTSHFLRRRCAIWRCCSAASRSSVASSFCKRRRRISR